MQSDRMDRVKNEEVKRRIRVGEELCNRVHRKVLKLFGHLGH